MKSCLWCGRAAGNAAACLRCAPNQGHARELEHDVEFDPDESYQQDIRALRRLLDTYGIAPIELEPPDQEFDDLNVERYLATLE